MASENSRGRPAIKTMVTSLTRFGRVKANFRSSVAIFSIRATITSSISISFVLPGNFVFSVVSKFKTVVARIRSRVVTKTVEVIITEQWEVSGVIKK